MTSLHLIQYLKVAINKCVVVLKVSGSNERIIFPEEHEERSMIEPRSYEDPKLRELMTILIDWINDELADQRIIVKDIEEDLYDGQVLQKLLGLN